MKAYAEWLKIAGAAIFEVLWVMGLKHAGNVLEWGLTAIAIIISFYTLISAGKRLPVGTVYAVFVGLGTVGTVLAELLISGEPMNLVKLLLVFVLLVGVVGLKMETKEAE
ncbi:DMT family transporter [Paenibacillus sp. sgz500958]|uniref:DMT family transporter n=1 Tax=Paenibacillus sp. sgz500958 TaxID=3242475 RepID=UPI0036D420F3